MEISLPIQRTYRYFFPFAFPGSLENIGKTGPNVKTDKKLRERIKPLLEPRGPRPFNNQHQALEELPQQGMGRLPGALACRSDEEVGWEST